MTTAPLREIVNLLGFSMRPRFFNETDAFSRTRRPNLSAGALHSVEVLVVDWRGAPRVFRYEPTSHYLESLRIARVAALQNFIATYKQSIPSGPDTSLVFVGDRRRIEALYDHADTLLWRDAGALLQTIAFVATAYRLAYCPLGILGNQIAEALALNLRDGKFLGCAAVGRSV